MTEIETLVYGIYPKTENLRKSLNRWERRKLPVEELKAILKAEKDIVFEMLKENKISCFTDPLFNWYDVFRPLLMIVDGIEIGPLTRYKETNTFYRLPIVQKIDGLAKDPKSDAEIDANPPLPLYQGTGLDGFMAFLPSPLSLFRMSKIEGDLEFNDFASGILKVYDDILASIGTERVLLFEPLEYEPEQRLSALNDFVEKHEVTLVASGGLKDSNFAGFRGKFKTIIVGENEGDIRIASKYCEELGVGLIDAHNTKVESAAAVRDKALKIASEFGLQKIIVANSDYLDFLPRSIADKKIKVLSEIGD